MKFNRRTLLRGSVATALLALVPDILVHTNTRAASGITLDTQVINVPPRISRSSFIRILQPTDVGSDAGACYDTLVSKRVDPLFFLAIFHHESDFGSEGICHDYQTHSPGNTRTVRLPGISTTTVTTPRGQFVKYHSWVDGFADTAYRIIDPHYVYAEEGRVTIGQIIPRWAPSSDGNSPTNYINAVVSDMNRWQESVTNLSGGFEAFYNHFAAKLTPTEMTVLFGAVLSPEMQEDGMTVQYFERQRFEWHPGTYPEFYDVLLTRYGAEDFTKKYG